MLGVTNATRVAAGERHSVVLLSDGTLKAAGYNGAGQVGNGTTASQWTTAVAVSTLTNVTAIAAGANHALALTSDGNLWAWGANADGQLGDGNAPTIRRAPAPIAGLSSIAHVGAGFNHSVAVTVNGVVFSWGKNADGQLGDGADWPRSVPSPISEPAYEWRVATPMLSVAPDT
jgi:alpha-tubulin suppressor-like RCC1 family protein